MKNRLAHLGKKMSDKTKKKLSILYKGKTLEERHGKEKAQIIKKKMVNKGPSNGMYGKKRPDLSKYNKQHPKIGEANPSWKGGISLEPYSFEFNKKLRQKIKHRDNFSCQLCNNNSNLVVHHIDYNKKNSFNGNLITLCNRCHGKTQHKRKYYEWQLNLFMNLWNNCNHFLKWKNEN